MRRLPGRRTWENLRRPRLVCAVLAVSLLLRLLFASSLIIKTLLVAASSSEHCQPSGKLCCPINYYNSSAWSSSYSRQLYHNNGHQDRKRHTRAIYDIYDGDGFADKHCHGDNGDGGGHRTELQFEIFKCPCVKPLPGTGH